MNSVVSLSTVPACSHSGPRQSTANSSTEALAKAMDARVQRWMTHGDGPVIAEGTEIVGTVMAQPCGGRRRTCAAHRSRRAGPAG